MHGGFGEKCPSAVLPASLSILTYFRVRCGRALAVALHPGIFDQTEKRQVHREFPFNFKHILLSRTTDIRNA